MPRRRPPLSSSSTTSLGRRQTNPTCPGAVHLERHGRGRTRTSDQGIMRGRKRPLRDSWNLAQSQSGSHSRAPLGVAISGRLGGSCYHHVAT